MKIYYEYILVGRVITNRSLAIEEALGLIGFDEEAFCREWGFDTIDYSDFHFGNRLSEFLVGWKWGGLSKDQQEELLKNSHYSGEGETILDFENGLSIDANVIVNDEESVIVIDDNSVVYDPTDR